MVKIADRFIDELAESGSTFSLDTTPSIINRFVNACLSEKWITIGGHAEGDEKHKGGFRVQIDGDGNILKGGPKSLHGKNVKTVKSHFDQERGKSKGGKITPSPEGTRKPGFMKQPEKKEEKTSTPVDKQSDKSTIEDTAAKGPAGDKSEGGKMEEVWNPAVVIRKGHSDSHYLLWRVSSKAKHQYSVDGVHWMDSQKEAEKAFNSVMPETIEENVRGLHSEIRRLNVDLLIQATTRTVNFAWNGEDEDVGVRSLGNLSVANKFLAKLRAMEFATDNDIVDAIKSVKGRQG